jgi:cystathionine beta-lyase/cystathionine gamma-synthase
MAGLTSVFQVAIPVLFYPFTAPIMATLVFDIETSGLPLERFDEAQQEYLMRDAEKLPDEMARVARREEILRLMSLWPADLGVNVAPDDAYLVLRGLRTLETRMKQHQASALEVARWVDGRPEVLRVLHPALGDGPQHALWKRDFTGASGVFSIVLKPAPTRQVHAFLDALQLFGLGFSYGGFESLAIYCDPQLKRTVNKPALGGPLIRLSIGLEDPGDLIADLEQALASLAA